MASKRDELLTVAQVLAELGNVSQRPFYRWREIGKVPAAVKLPNGELRIWGSDLMRGSIGFARAMRREVLRREVLGDPAGQGQDQPHLRGPVEGRPTAVPPGPNADAHSAPDLPDQLVDDQQLGARPGTRNGTNVERGVAPLTPGLPGAGAAQRDAARSSARARASIASSTVSSACLPVHEA